MYLLTKLEIFTNTHTLKLSWVTQILINVACSWPYEFWNIRGLFLRGDPMLEKSQVKSGLKKSSNLMALQNSHHNFEFSTQYHIYKWSRKIFQLPSCKMAGRTSFEMLENFFSGMTLYWKKSQVKSGSHKRSNLTAWWASHPISTPESNSPRKSTCISSLGRVFFYFLLGKLLTVQVLEC